MSEIEFIPSKPHARELCIRVQKFWNEKNGWSWFYHSTAHFAEINFAYYFSSIHPFAIVANSTFH
jgi:hypothetical protein